MLSRKDKQTKNDIRTKEQTRKKYDNYISIIIYNIYRTMKLCSESRS